MQRPVCRSPVFCAFLAAVIAAALGMTAPAAQAQGIDMTRGGAVDITADNGIEWRRDEQIVIAQGNARATRGGVTVTADRLIARYRPRRGAAAAQRSSGGDTGLGGANEIYRLEARGHVVITTATDRATGEQATYDMDQAVLVMTGSNLSITSKEQTLTARDSLEYWSQRHMAVARGDAVARDTENRVIRADVLVGYFKPDNAAQTPAARTPANARPGGNTRVDRIEAFGNVEVRTATEVLRGDRGVYSPDQGIARVAGNVRITRGQDQLNGSLAETNLNTGVSRLLAAPGDRVEGVIIRESDTAPPAPQPPPSRPERR